MRGRAKIACHTDSLNNDRAIDLYSLCWGGVRVRRLTLT